jgi:hypothetical protein
MPRVHDFFCCAYLVSVRKWLFSTISASDEDFNPRNTQCIPPVKIFVFLDLAKNILFSDGHYLVKLILTTAPLVCMNFLKGSTSILCIGGNHGNEDF